MKQIIFKILIFFRNYFPFNRGKYQFSNIIYHLFGTFWVKKNGVYLKILPNSTMDLTYFLNETKNYHDVILSEINSIKEGDTFIDIGANIGYFSFIASKKVGEKGKVYSFEPSHREFIRFLQGVIKNKIVNLISLNAAIGNNNSLIRLNSFSNDHSGLNSVLTEYKNTGYDVSMFKLEEIITNESLINLIKIDVEGYEMNVLLGCKKLFEKRLVKKMVIEITPELLEKAGFSKKALYEYLIKFGFEPKFNFNSPQYDEVFEYIKL